MRFYGTADIPTDLDEKSFAYNIARVMPNGMAPLFAMSGLAKKQTIANIEHGYWTKTMEFTVLTIVAPAVTTAAQTTIPVASAAGVLPGQLIRVPKPFVAGAYVLPEFMYVTSVNYSTNVITVTRNFGGDAVPVASIPATTKLAVVTNAHAEASGKPVSRAIKPTRVQNYTQIFRNAWSTGNTLAEVKMIAGKGSIAENKDDAIAFHATDIEYATLFGRKYIGTDPATGERIHTMDGIEAMVSRYAPSNIVEAGASTTYKQLCDLVNPTLNFRTDFMNGNKRALYVGRQALDVINEIGRLSGEYQLVDSQTNFGLQFQTFKTSRGQFQLVEHPLLNTNSDYEKMAFVVDLSSFDFKYLGNRDAMWQYINNKADNSDGSDAQGGVITSELTIECQNPFAFGVLYNLRSAAM